MSQPGITFFDDKPPFDVLRVEGRYPHRPTPLLAENIVAEVTRIGPDLYQIRVDDTANPESWSMLTIQLTGEINLPDSDEGTTI